MPITIKKINETPLFPIGLGAMPLSIQGRPSHSSAKAVIKKFIELGGNFIDTANVYSLNEFDTGHNEKLISETLASLGCLDQVIIATKGGATRPNGGWAFGGGHPKQLRKACETSLQNLKLSTHKLYYLHGLDPSVPFADSLGELIHLKKEGKILNIGIANINLDDLKLAHQMTNIAAVQNRCNPFCKTDFQNGLIAFCKRNNILYVAYCPLGGWYDHVKLAQSELYNYFTAKYNINSYLIALSWLLSKTGPILPIPGMEKITFVSNNFQSATIRLEEDDIKKIDHFPDLYSSSHKIVRTEI